MKQILILLLLALVASVSGCKKDEGPTNNQPALQSCANFPPSPGERWVYGILQGTQYVPFDTGMRLTNSRAV